MFVINIRKKYAIVNKRCCFYQKISHSLELYLPNIIKIVTITLLTYIRNIFGDFTMKLHYTALLILVFTIFLFSSCESTPSEPIEDPNFIGDFDPIQLENVLCLRESFGKLTPTEIRLYFVPRTNIVEMYLRDGMTAYVLLFEGDERKQLFEGIDMYAKAYASYQEGNKIALDVREPDRKNYFNEGDMSVSWGVASTARNNTTTFQTNYKYLEENRPYFELLVEKTKDKDNASVFSPVLRLYFSPTHLENLLYTLNQENLELLVEELEAEAFAF